MPNWLKRLFRRNIVPPPFDIEKAVGHYLLTLPQCTNRVLVVSRRYLDKRYNYELTVDAASLAAWATGHEKSAWCSYEPNQAARQALPLWLRGADLTDNSVSFPPQMFFTVLRGYQENFLTMATAQAYCHECCKIISDLSIESTELSMSASSSCVRYELHCPSGHLLYQEEHELLFCRPGRGLPSLISKQ